MSFLWLKLSRSQWLCVSLSYLYNGDDMQALGALDVMEGGKGGAKGGKEGAGFGSTRSLWSSSRRGLAEGP